MAAMKIVLGIVSIVCALFGVAACVYFRHREDKERRELKKQLDDIVERFEKLKSNSDKWQQQKK